MYFVAQITIYIINYGFEDAIRLCRMHIRYDSHEKKRITDCHCLSSTEQILKGYSFRVLTIINSSI